MYLGAVKRRESEYYHPVLTWFDEERDELEPSPNKTQVVRRCPSAKFMFRHGVAPCFNPVSHWRPKPSPAISPSSPRWLMVVCGSATSLAELALCRMAASRISHRTKASPQVVFTHLRRTRKGECG